MKKLCFYTRNASIRYYWQFHVQIGMYFFSILLTYYIHMKIHMKIYNALMKVSVMIKFDPMFTCDCTG